MVILSNHSPFVMHYKVYQSLTTDTYGTSFADYADKIVIVDRK